MNAPRLIDHAVRRLREGGLVAFPTETVYGLGADAFSEPAIAGVFRAKGRPSTNPLIVHVSGPEMAKRCVREWTADADTLARAFWPGPLTLVLDRSDSIPATVAAGGPTVGVRVPDHPLTMALLEAFGGPLVGPSANLSGTVSPTRADHVRAAWTEDEVMVLDGGPCRAGLESTVLDLTESPPRVLRPGVIGTDDIARVLGREVVGPTADADPHTHTSPTTPARSPGLLSAHYRPASPVTLYRTRDELAALRQNAAGRTVAISPPGDSIDTEPDHATIELPADAPGYAAALYAALRDADAMRPVLIAVWTPTPVLTLPGAPDRAIWTAIAERLSRAAR